MEIDQLLLDKLSDVLTYDQKIRKIGFCLPAGPYVSDEDVHYIVDCIKEAIAWNSKN